MKMALTVFFLDDLSSELASYEKTKWTIRSAEFYSHCKVVSVGDLPLTLIAR
jgi:hypothetical protein